jgi:hypothetical protein
VGKQQGRSVYCTVLYIWSCAAKVSADSRFSDTGPCVPPSSDPRDTPPWLLSTCLFRRSTISCHIHPDRVSGLVSPSAFCMVLFAQLGLLSVELRKVPDVGVRCLSWLLRSSYSYYDRRWRFREYLRLLMS